MTALFLKSFLPAILLATGFFIWLRHARFDCGMAGLLTGVIFAQAGVLICAVEPGHSLWLTAGTAAVAASAANFAARQDARRVIILGGSLAAIQFSAPLGGLMAAGMLPAAVAIGHARSDLRKTAGLFALLLFVPAITAGVLFYLARVQNFTVADFASVPLRPGAQEGFTPWLVASFGLVVVPLPAQWGLRCALYGRAPLLVALGSVAAAVLAAIAGMTGDPSSLMAVAAPLTLAALAGWPPSRERKCYALVAAVLCLVLSWGFLLWSMPRPIAG